MFRRYSLLRALFDRQDDVVSHPFDSVHSENLDLLGVRNFLVPAELRGDKAADFGYIHVLVR